MKDPLGFAIRYFERTSHTKVSSIREIEGGTGNNLFLVNWDYVVRVKRKNDVDGEFNTPNTEVAAISFAQKIPFSPIAPICHYDSVNGNKIETAIKDVEPLVSDNEHVTLANLKRVIDAIKVFHQAQPVYSFSAEHRFYSYKKKSGEALPAGYEKKVLRDALRIIESEDLVLSHNDLWAGNILLPSSEPSKAYLIDLEFASGNADIFDLASLLEENEIPENLCLEAIRYYYGLNFDEEKVERVKKMMLFLDALWFYWAMARYKETGKEAFRSIAKTKKERFLRSFRKSISD